MVQKMDLYVTFRICFGTIQLEILHYHLTWTEAALETNILKGGGSGVRLYDGPDLKLFILVGWGRSFLSVAWPTGVQLVFFFCSGVSRLFGAQGSPSSGSLLNL